MNYIIQQGVQIGKCENKIIDVLSSDQIRNYLKDGFLLKERMYKLTLGHNQYTVVCWEIWKESDTEHTLILPEFLIPHRTYAVYVYAYAIAQYSTNPRKSQRTVAEETRIKFNLQTFSHTTLSRAMRELAQILSAPAFESSETITGRQEREPEEEKIADETKEDTAPTGRFSTAYTKVQRALIQSFFCSRGTNPGQHSFPNACKHMIAYWYRNLKRLFCAISAPGTRCKLFL